MFKDTHTHLNFKSFKYDWRKVVDRAVESGVEKMIVVGTDIESSNKAVELAKAHKSLYASVGIHPHHAKGIMNNESGFMDLGKQLRMLAEQRKVVAIGEVGLDYHTYKNSKYEIRNLKKEWKKIVEDQIHLLKMQVSLAKEFDMPLIIHSREAGEQVLDVIVEVSNKLVWMPKGVFHCFEGNKRYLKRILVAGFYVSFTGNITYSEDRAKVALMMPIDKLLLETDSPFMAPKPHRGERNEPINVKIVAAHHAKMRKLQLNEVVRETTLNAKKLFGL